MSERIRIARVHRNALYGDLLQSLVEVDDLQSLGHSRDPKDIEGFERIGRRMADALRLIQDGGLGWGYPDTQEPCELTLPPEELRRIIAAKRGNLAALGERERTELEEFEEDWKQPREARKACSSILEQLGEG